MGFVQSTPWLHILPKSHLHLPQPLHHHLLRRRHHRHHHHHHLHHHHRHHRHHLLHQVIVGTSPIVHLIKHAVASMNFMASASSMVAATTRMRFAALELNTAARVITPFVMSPRASVSRYRNSTHPFISITPRSTLKTNIIVVVRSFQLLLN